VGAIFDDDPAAAIVVDRARVGGGGERGGGATAAVGDGGGGGRLAGGRETIRALARGRCVLRGHDVSGVVSDGVRVKDEGGRL
jgi:hypothetical protein